MSKKTEELRERTAYHEAGHVVMDLLLMLPFDAVSIKTIQKKGYQYKNGQKVPITYIVAEGVMWSQERQESVNKNISAGILDLREALALMAGPEAEKIFIGKVDELAQFGAQTDIQGVVACCRAAISPGKTAENWMVSVMENDIIQGVFSQAGELLQKNWASVMAVADALLKYRHLTYEEAKMLMDKQN